MLHYRDACDYYYYRCCCNWAYYFWFSFNSPIYQRSPRSAWVIQRTTIVPFGFVMPDFFVQMSFLSPKQQFKVLKGLPLHSDKLFKTRVGALGNCFCWDTRYLITYLPPLHAIPSQHTANRFSYLPLLLKWCFHPEESSTSVYYTDYRTRKTNKNNRL